MMKKKIAILQSCYIPWKGYFDIINSVDEFIIYDDVQYTKNDWRNRNLIKTPNGLKWLSIPVNSTSTDKIKDVRVVDNIWRKKHWKSIIWNYSKTQFFKDYRTQFEQLYLNGDEEFISQINYTFLMCLIKILGIKTKISWSWKYSLEGDKTERLVNICKQAGAGVYLSGPSAQNYIQADKFVQEGILLEWMDYTGYREYRQLFPPFEHGVTILDLIFNEGPGATDYLKSFKQNEKQH
jgi:hypothetical protein